MMRLCQTEKEKLAHSFATLVNAATSPPPSPSTHMHEGEAFLFTNSSLYKHRQRYMSSEVQISCLVRLNDFSQTGFTS
jgi:hypothetical protein